MSIERGYDAVVTLDADFSHDPADIPALLAALADADVVIGSRYVGGVRVLNWEIQRLLLSLAANGYVKLIAGLPCRDCTAGFRAYRVELLSKLSLPRIGSGGYSLLPEILFELTYLTDRIREVPVCFTERRLGASKMSGGVMLEAALQPWRLLVTRILRAARGRSRARAIRAAQPPAASRGGCGSPLRASPDAGSGRRPPPVTTCEAGGEVLGLHGEVVKARVHAAVAAPR